MAALYQLCSVTLRPLLRARTTRTIIVSGFTFSIVGDDGGLGTLFMRAVWGDETGPDRRFPRLVAHRPERVQAIHRALARTWTTERARYAAPDGDEYGDWFAGELENVLRLYREASEHDQWITNDPEHLERALSPFGLPPLPLLDNPSPPSHDSPDSPSPIGIAGLLTLGAVGLCSWRGRRIAARRERSREPG